MKLLYQRVVLLTILSLIFIGCGRKPTIMYTPKLQTVAITEIGKNMFSKMYAYSKHQHYVKLINAEDNRKYNVSEIGNPFDKVDDVPCALYNYSKSLLDYNCDGYFTHFRDGTPLEKPVKYRIIPTPTSRLHLVRDSFRYDVLYQGKVGNKLKITFREFISAKGTFIIRDAFTQTIEYELDNKGEALIGFKGLRIKVLHATNMDIKYKVIHDFD